jgi:thiamine-monophosphate kinase
VTPPVDPDPAGDTGPLTEPPPTGEFAAIARWTRPEPWWKGVRVGPGDDVAWLESSLFADLPLAISVDTVVEGVHFRLDWSTPADVGWKAVAAALSDLAAGRARARGALISLAVPSGALAAGGIADELMSGARACLDLAFCPLIGGDTVSTPGPISLSVTVLGESTEAGPLLRSGAQPGDLLQLSGPTGLAAWAVAWLKDGRQPPESALTAHRRPRARLDLAPAIRAATAGIDVSDGLMADAGWIAKASGVVLEFDRGACLASPATHADERGTAWVLSGGDDYELLVTAPSPLPGFRTVGRVVEGSPALRWADGVDVVAAGWNHGAAS